MNFSYVSRESVDIDIVYISRCHPAEEYSQSLDLCGAQPGKRPGVQLNLSGKLDHLQFSRHKNYFDLIS